MDHGRDSDQSWNRRTRTLGHVGVRAAAIAALLALTTGSTALGGSCVGWWAESEQGARRNSTTTNNLGVRAYTTLTSASTQVNQFVARMLWIRPANGQYVAWGVYKGDGYIEECPNQTAGWKLFRAGYNAVGDFYCYSPSHWPTYTTNDPPFTLKIVRTDPPDGCEYDWEFLVGGTTYTSCYPMSDYLVRWRYSASDRGGAPLHVNVEYDDMQRRIYSSQYNEWVWSSISGGDSCADDGYHVDVITNDRIKIEED